MKFKIHRGTKEIGGTCIEVWTDSTRILVDFGMPLVEGGGSQFDFRKYSSLSVKDLLIKGVLPDVKGAYGKGKTDIDGLIISHPHQDHYGFYNYLNKNIKCYLGRATHQILKLNNLFTPQTISIANPVYFEREKAFKVRDITITPYWADHSAFDSYSLLIESGENRIFYSGDFRGHGRKSGAFKWFKHNAPEKVDYLLLEGTSVGRGEERYQTEQHIEEELVKLFLELGKANLVYTSGQNIDRLVSVYRACLKSDKTLVVDVYVATILKQLSEFADLPHPSKAFRNLRVMYTYFTNKRLKQEGKEEILWQFKHYKITKEEIGNKPEDLVMLIRPSMQKDLDLITGIDGGNFIYSLWEGYLKNASTRKFVDYMVNRGLSIHKIHTSGHADVPTLREMIQAIKPSHIVPIHTFGGSEYQKLFPRDVVVELKDGQVCIVN